MANEVPEIALYGLSADPPHQGHAEIMALLTQRFDQVWVWAVDNLLKNQGVAPLAARQAMVALTVKHLGLPNLEHHPEFTSPWTAESVAIIHFLYPEARLWVVLGSDALQQVEQWGAVPLLLARIEGFVEIARAGQTSGLSQIRGRAVRSLEVEIPPYASREIRQNLLQGELPKGLQSEVYNYILKNRLYPGLDSTDVGKGEYSDLGACPGDD